MIRLLSGRPVWCAQSQRSPPLLVLLLTHYETADGIPCNSDVLVGTKDVDFSESERERGGGGGGRERRERERERGRGREGEGERERERGNEGRGERRVVSVSM